MILHLYLFSDTTGKILNYIHCLGDIDVRQHCSGLNAQGSTNIHMNYVIYLWAQVEKIWALSKIHGCTCYICQ